MADYILYLDESETFSSPNQRYFSIGGVIVSTCNRPAIETDIIQLKSRLWDGDFNSSQYILHEKESSFKDTVLRQLYDGNMNNRQKYGLKVIP